MAAPRAIAAAGVGAEVGLEALQRALTIGHLVDRNCVHVGEDSPGDPPAEDRGHFAVTC